MSIFMNERRFSAGNSEAKATPIGQKMVCSLKFFSYFVNEAAHAVVYLYISIIGLLEFVGMLTESFLL